MKKDNCIFCKIAAGEIPSATVYEDDSFRAILDLGPAAKGHTLVIPKEHYEDLLSAKEDITKKALPVIAKTAGAVKAALGCDGINVLQNNGEAAGQTVHHLHFHIIPRYNGDNVNISWQPGEPSAEELADTAELIIRKL